MGTGGGRRFRRCGRSAGGRTPQPRTLIHDEQTVDPKQLKKQKGNKFLDTRVLRHATQLFAGRGVGGIVGFVWGDSSLGQTTPDLRS